MPMAGSKRRKSTPPRKPKRGRPIQESVDENVLPSLSKLYAECVTNDSWDAVRRYDEWGAVAQVIWPHLRDTDPKDVHACHLLVLFLAYRSRHGAASAALRAIEVMEDNNNGGGSNEKIVSSVLDTLFYETVWADGNVEAIKRQTQILQFVLVVMSATSSDLRDAMAHHVGGDLWLWQHMPPRRRELELKRNGAGLRRKYADLEQTSTKPWIASVLNNVVRLLEGHSQYGALVKLKDDEGTSQKMGSDEEEEYGGDDKELKKEPPPEVWSYLHRALELLIDLLSVFSTRRFLVAYLDATHFYVRCKFAIGGSGETNLVGISEPMRLVQQLLDRIYRFITFPVMEHRENHLSKVNIVSMYHTRATTLQKMAHRHYPKQLQELVFAGVGLLCAKPLKKEKPYLYRVLAGFPDGDLFELMYRLRLMEHSNEDKLLSSNNREFMLLVLQHYLNIPPYPHDQLLSLPLYPTEIIMWDHNRIPPSNKMLRSFDVLSLPKLILQFLSFQDYLQRNFELVRLESAYGIRSDLVQVLKRVRPVLRQVVDENDVSGNVSSTTDFAGWSRMALEIASPLTITKVLPPKLGETTPSRVTAQFTIDLERCGDAIRAEWDEIGEHDNLFLVAMDASRMTGAPAPLLKDYHLSHGARRKQWDIDNNQRRIPDEDDSSFPLRFGVVAVRGCLVLQIRNEDGDILSDPTTSMDIKQKSTKRIIFVSLDTAQYAMDMRSPGGTGVYQRFNLVVRRHGRENNFRAVLETVRGLMNGVGSINRVLPPWLQLLLLGNNDSKIASYKSSVIKEYAAKTVGVNAQSDYLDFGDTFLDEAHLRECFKGSVVVDGRDGSGDVDKTRRNYRVRVKDMNDDCPEVIEASSYDFPKDTCGNKVRFTPVQVEAIRSGLSPGLTMIVGPPGTGKTDVAVQIIASLYHSFPTQRTIIITHSNAALNDIFQKVMARGDIEERFMVRLGAGERDLKVESSHDFTKIGRVAYSLRRRDLLLGEVQELSESIGISSKADRGADGSSAYTCETASYFYRHHVRRLVNQFEKKLAGVNDEMEDVVSIFPFRDFFKIGDSGLPMKAARQQLSRIDEIFEELTEYRPFELLRSQRQRSDYLVLKQARVVAMTCTHAAIARSHLIFLGFEYDNIVMEEAGQMLEIESFVPMLLQGGQSDESVSGTSRLKRICVMGDHQQLPPVIKNSSFSQFSNMDQSMFSRLIRLGVPYTQLDKQGRARPELARLYSWRYSNLGDLDHVTEAPEFKLANPGFVHMNQLINVEDYEGRGESAPTAYFYQNVGEAEYVVALFQYMVLIGHNPKKISIITTYNGQKELISDIVSKRCGVDTPFSGITPGAISTVDQYQGQQNDYILLSLVRTESVGHIRDVRRLIVAVSRARLGLYVFCRQRLFQQAHELKPTMEQFQDKPNRLQLVMNETVPTQRKAGDHVEVEKLLEIEDVSHLGSIVHSMQESWMIDRVTENE